MKFGYYISWVLENVVQSVQEISTYTFQIQIFLLHALIYITQYYVLR